jgi:ribokinase
MDTPRIAVVGSSNTDMVVKAKRIPRPGETVTNGTFVMAPGGKGANQAVGAARLGAWTTLIAKVGDDLFGYNAVEGFTKEGIEVHNVLFDDQNATGTALILVDEKGENSIAVAPGANHALTPEEIDQAADAIEDAEVLLLQLETPLDAVQRAAEIAAAAEKIVVLDPAPAPDERLPESLLKLVTYLTPNETEAESLTGIKVTDETSARKAADVLIQSGVQNVIVTLGAKGAVFVGRELKTFFVEGRPVAAIDSTAAGDSFNGALAVALASEKPIEEAVRYACLAASISVTRMGAQPSLPTREEVEALETK